MCNKGKYVKENWKTKIGNGKCEKNLKKKTLEKLKLKKKVQIENIKG